MKEDMKKIKSTIVGIMLIVTVFVTLFTFIVPIAKATDLTPNCYAQWHLNATSGTNVADSSGNGRSGTTVNSPTWVTGKLNNGLSFTGTSSQYVDCGSIASFERTQACSYEFWFNTSTTAKQVLSKYNTSQRGMSIDIGPGTVRFLLVSTTSGNNYMYVQTVADTFCDGKWHHCIITYSGNSLSSGVHIYVDGVDKSLYVIMNSLSGSILNTDTFKIGHPANSIAYYNGKLDEIVIYNKALTLDDISYRYNSGVGRESLSSNVAPIFDIPSPTNSSTGQPKALTWSIPINDANGDTFNWTIQCSNGQSSSANGTNNGTKSLSISGLASLTTYKVYVNATDGTAWTHSWYTFTTVLSYTDIEILPNLISVKKGTQVKLSVYVTPEAGTWIDTVVTDEVTFTASKLQFVGTHVTWGNLFQDAIFQMGGTPDNVNGNITNIIWGTSVNESDPGYLYNMTFNTVVTGYAYVNLTYSKIGVALDGNDKPKRIVSNGTIFVHEYTPNLPSSFVAVAVNSSQINLSWAKGTEADKTYIEWNTTANWTRGKGHPLYNSTGTAIQHTNLTFNTIYYYRAWSWNDTDDLFSTFYSEVNASTFTILPDQPTVIHPINNSDYESVYDQYLEVHVTDPNDNNMTVSFYWGNGIHISSVSVVNNSNALLDLLPYINPDWLVHDSDYMWYAWVNNTLSEIRSSTYIFHTSMAWDINEDRTVNYLDVSNLVTHYHGACLPGEIGADINNDGKVNYLDVSLFVSHYGENY